MSLNGISTLATRQARLTAKLNLAQAKRQGKVVAADGTISGSIDPTKQYYRALNTVDVNLLPTKYSGNTLVQNTHPSTGLAEHHPWV